MEEIEFIKSIVEDAKQEAVQIETNAKLFSARQIEDAKKELDAQKTRTVESVKASIELQKSRAEMAVKVESGKTIINQKQDALNEVFESAKAEISGESAAATKSLISALVKKFAKSGDTILVSKKDEKVLTEEFIKGLSVKGLKRAVSPKVKSGITISGATYDTDLTLETLLKEIADDKMLEVAKILF
ncbi:MAG: V-type ATP synthase subunit E [Christensenellaceae bacterium]|jgi:vacuolar-type H+-ATPase subunit E/Vma4|nr:V-type ATP synthase subunit E [Christensenellaceae bacterium]